MKKLLIPLLSVIVSFSPTLPAAAEEVLSPPPHSVIAALQTGQPAAHGNDFVEIYNPADMPQDVTGWKLQYRAAAATGNAAWTTKKTLTCATLAGSPACSVVLGSRRSLVFATYAIDDVTTQLLSSGFSDTGGQVRLVDAGGRVVDMLGYGTAAEAEGGKPATAPPLGQSIVRAVNDEGAVVDTDDNAADFAPGCYQPLPQGEIAPSQPPTVIACPEELEPDDPPAAMTTTPTLPPSDPIVQPDAPAPLSYARLLINELFPDPASPQTDSADEFIELFNPGGEAVTAAGYVLESGADYRYHFTLGDDVVLPPGGYVAITSADSHLSLTNSGTSVRLRDPNGTVVDEVANYGQAKSGQAWADVGGTWQWTTTPTPGRPNVATSPAVLAAAVSATAKKVAVTTTKKAAAKTTTATTPKTAKTQTASKTTAKAASTTPGLATDQNNNSFLNYALLIPIGLVAVGYVGYEYRKDIASFWRKIWRAVTGQKAEAADDVTRQTD